MRERERERESARGNIDSCTSITWIMPEKNDTFHTHFREKQKYTKNILVRLRSGMHVTVLYTKNDAGRLVHLFLDRMQNLKLSYLSLVFFYNLSQL